MTRIKEQLNELLNSYPNAEIYLNVTNGIEAIEYVLENQKTIRYCCIQSTHFEQKTLDQAMNQLGADLLMHLATGTPCIIIDYGANKTLSRAVYQGIPFIKYTLERIWYDKQPTSIRISPREPGKRDLETADTFDTWFTDKLTRKTKRWLKRFKIYANTLNPTKEITIIGISNTTTHDNDKEWHAKHLHQQLENQIEP